MGPGGIKYMSRAYDVLFTRCPRRGLGEFPQLLGQSVDLIDHLDLRLRRTELFVTDNNSSSLSALYCRTSIHLVPTMAEEG